MYLVQITECILGNSDNKYVSHGLFEKKTLNLAVGNAHNFPEIPEGGEVVIRADDELKAYVDGEVKADDFSTAGWDWQKVSTFDASGAGLLAFRMYNMVSNLCILNCVCLVFCLSYLKELHHTMSSFS